MTAQVPVNSWQVNQQAKRWLLKIKESPDPQVLYLAQLAQWGLENQKVELPEPLSPSQPMRPALEQVALGLLEPGAKAATKAMRLLLSNPNLHPEDAAQNLLSALQQASSSEEAAAVVIETIYDLMVATSP